MQKIKIEICSGTSCHLMGAYDLHQAVKVLGPKYKPYIEISSITCLGNCGRGPNVRINGDVYPQITPDELKNIIKKQLSRKRGEEDGEE